MLNLGWATFHLYGFLIGLGVLAGVYVASRKDKQVWEAWTWLVAGGIVGARLYHVLSLWWYYRQFPLEIVKVWQGGMGILGAIAGGLVGLALYARSRQKLIKLLDLTALGLPLGQAIGRWGNWFNQELYGRPTSLPWGIYIQPENRLLPVMDFERFHPLFLYESLWCLLIFLAVRRAFKLIPLGKGKLLGLYLILYGLGRFLLEFLRIESWQILGINVAQAIALTMVAGGLWLFF